MSINFEKVALLVGFVDRLIQAKEIANQVGKGNAVVLIDEKSISEFIEQALAIINVSFSEEEIAAVKRDITYKYQVKVTPGQSILADYEQKDWYEDAKNSEDFKPVFWSRYKDYLIDKQHFSPTVVTDLGAETLDQKLMNYILDPTETYPSPMLKRGLVIGDVQSGKTSTYIGFICKAADACTLVYRNCMLRVP